MSPEQKLRSLFDDHSRSLLAYALRRVTDREDAADIVAETFVIAWRRLDEVPEGDEGRPRLFGVARRVLANHRRGEARRHALADRLRSELRGIAVAPPPEDDRVAHVGMAMDRLDDDDRELLRLVAWEGLTPSQVARAMGLAPGAVRTRLFRARRRLRQALEAVRDEQCQPTPPPAAAVVAAASTHANKER